MLGWEIFVSRRERKIDGLIRSSQLIAAWEVGLSGTDWLDALTQEGKAINLGGNGYPNRWAASVAGLRPVLEKGIPTGKAKLVVSDDDLEQFTLPVYKKFHRDLLANLPPEEMLDIEAWDQS
jgi:hypothetical protein